MARRAMDGVPSTWAEALSAIQPWIFAGNPPLWGHNRVIYSRCEWQDDGRCEAVMLWTLSCQSWVSMSSSARFAQRTRRLPFTCGTGLQSFLVSCMWFSEVWPRDTTQLVSRNWRCQSLPRLRASAEFWDKACRSTSSNELFSGVMRGWLAATKHVPGWEVQVALDSDPEAVAHCPMNHQGTVIREPGLMDHDGPRSSRRPTDHL